MSCLAALLVSCASGPTTSSTTQDTYGVCTDVPIAPGQDSVSCLYNQTVSYASGIAYEVQYLGPISTGCTVSRCVSVLGIGGGHSIDCICDLGASCASYDCPGNVPLEQCTQID